MYLLYFCFLYADGFILLSAPAASSIYQKAPVLPSPRSHPVPPAFFLLPLHFRKTRFPLLCTDNHHPPSKYPYKESNLLLFLSAAVPTPITVPQPSGSSKASHLAEFARSRYSWYSSSVIVCPDSFSLVSGKSSSADSSAASAPCEADASSYISSSVTVGSSFFSPHAESIMTADRTAHSLKYLLILHPPCILV